MNACIAAANPRTGAYELRFRSIFDASRGYSFPCDPEGHVDLDALSERSRCNYLYARAVIGRDLSVPAVQPVVTN